MQMAPQSSPSLARKHQAVRCSCVSLAPSHACDLPTSHRARHRAKNATVIAIAGKDAAASEVQLRF